MNDKQLETAEEAARCYGYTITEEECESGYRYEAEQGFLAGVAWQKANQSSREDEIAREAWRMAQTVQFENTMYNLDRLTDEHSPHKDMTFDNWFNQQRKEGKL